MSDKKRDSSFFIIKKIPGGIIYVVWEVLLTFVYYRLL